MSVEVGFKGKLGIAEQVDFTTGIAVGSVSSMIPFLSESLSPEIARISSNVIDGAAGQRADRRGNQNVNGGIDVELDFTNLTTLLKACFGSESSGTFTFIDTEHTPLTMLIEKTVSRFRAIGAKCDSFSLAGNAGENWMLSSQWKCYNADRSATAFPSISLAAREPWKFDGTKIRLNRISDGALADNSHQIYATNISIEVAHGLEEPKFVSRSSNANLPIEPLKANWREVKVMLTMARYEDTANITNVEELIDWEAAESKLQMDITVTGSSNSCVMRFPHMKITQIPNINVSGPEPSEVPIELVGFINNSDNALTNMTFSEEMRLIIS